MNPPSYAPSVVPSNQENEEMQHCEMGRPVTHMQTLYMPIESPPTPAPSPGPVPNCSSTYPLGLASNHLLNTHDPVLRRQILASILMSCSPSELLFISTTVAPLLKRDSFGCPQSCHCTSSVSSTILHHLCAHLWSVNTGTN